MKNSRAIAIFSLLLSAAWTASAEPLVTSKQELTALDYFKHGRQSGCGIRTTAVAADDRSINVLLSVFSNEAGPPFGMFKVVVRKMINNGEPLQDGKPGYSSIGKIHYAWLKTAGGAELSPNKNETASHGEGYMTSLKFSSAMDMLGAIAQTDFTIGISTDQQAPDTVFAFNQRISQNEAGKLFICMKNLRDALDGKPSAEVY
ncbi:MAG: hypothetical protein V4443_00445 [Pseudomonadota bacterium]